MEISTSLRQYLDDKLGMDVMGLTPLDVPRKLLPKGISEQSVKKVQEILKNCEIGIYSGQEYGKSNRLKLKESTILLVKKLEKEIRR